MHELILFSVYLIREYQKPLFTIWGRWYWSYIHKRRYKLLSLSDREVLKHLLKREFSNISKTNLDTIFNDFVKYLFLYARSKNDVELRILRWYAEFKVLRTNPPLFVNNF